MSMFSEKLGAFKADGAIAEGSAFRAASDDSDVLRHMETSSDLRL